MIADKVPQNEEIGGGRKNRERSQFWYVLMKSKYEEHRC